MIYHTGDIISGQVLFNIPEPTDKIDEIYVSLTGDVGYTTTRTVRLQNGQIERKTDQFDIRILGQRFLLDRPIFVNQSGAAVSAQPADRSVLRPGQYKYPFSMRIPDHLPPTLHPEDYPYVRYQIQVLIEKKWYHANDRQRYPIRIHPRVNLLTINNSQSAVKFGTKHKDVTIRGLLQRAGLLPGEHGHLVLSIDNPSRLSIKHIDICLIQRYEIEQCRRRVELFRTTIPQISNMNESRFETNCAFDIPAGVPPSFNFTSKETRTVVHVSLHYDLKLEVKAKGFFTDFDLQVPIIIGSPMADQSLAQSQSSRRLNQIRASEKEAPPPAYDTLRHSLHH